MSEPRDRGDYVHPRWLAPQDGGRGRELRRRWSCIRWFSWRYGTAWHRFRHRFVTLTWHFGYRDEVLFGLVSFEDEDGDRYTHVGLWPWHLRITVAAWERPAMDSPRSTDD